MKNKKHTNTGYKVKKSFSGFGLFATRDYKKGEEIIEYTGKIISNKEADKKMGRYLFELSSRRTIDGSGRENTARYINHSCEPNAEAINHGNKVMIEAKKKILSGEEITYDYGKEYVAEFIAPYGCLCGKCSNSKKK
ncbi:SET domain-containing protein-lysine N-methyltransferase [Candidatus Nomurabacteria bacterium]|nr:SET domain-containing protein-lysine N-methyltransferase [Candidatus Nomurabacteria bacterium]USN94622.1 MAG: SET domain-containing protein-lysine N-methyltransferase [Candidatus Nomurabacteria bacterium]